MTTILRPDHFTILTDDLPATEAFYARFLGFTSGPRPNFSFAGLWLYANEKAVLHVKQVDVMPVLRNGVLDHMAFRGKDINSLLGKLTDGGVSYQLKRTPDPWNDWQLFFEDPNGAVVEVDFESQEVVDSQYQAKEA